LGPRPRQWMYGTTVNLRYIVVPELPCPNPLPINLRLAEYAADDLVIDWSPQNLVTNVKRPTIEVPPEADALLDALYFVDELVGLLLRSKQSSIDQAIDGNSQSGRE